ncbi:ExbD/TolR family protein [Desulfolithobacter sp.]
MIVHPRRRVIQPVQIPMTPLIDMVFLLLIYFLLTSNFLAEEGISVNPPRVKSGAPHVEEVLTITVDREGNAFIDRQEFSRKRLAAELKRCIAASPDRIIVVKADRSVELEKAVRILDLARIAGARRLSLATETEY